MRTCALLNSYTTRTTNWLLRLLGVIAVGVSLTVLCLFTPKTYAASQFIGSAPGNPIARPTGLGAAASPVKLARAFIALRATDFGVGGSPRELLRSSLRKTLAGRAVVRFQQMHRGIPVLGGELVVNLDAGGNILSAGGETLDATHLSVVPRVTPSNARRAAIAATARAHAIPAPRLRASEPRLWIYDSRLLGSPGPERPTLTWRMDVMAGGRIPTDELVLVDARRGVVTLHFDQIMDARYRRVCDAANTSEQLPCTAPVRTEGEPPASIADVDGAYELTGATYDFYRQMFGRDSLDGAGMPLVSTTRYCSPDDPCPWANAAWVPSAGQMVFGQGFASADDVIAHELTHAVIGHTSDLFNYYQSGAIGESIADTLGELFDQTNGTGTDTDAVRWQLGEDTPMGAIRDMRNPSNFDQPDRMASPYYATGRDDSGGVHANSGVGNKAAFLITEGGTFNGRTINGLGIAKAARIYYELATNELTSASDYEDLSYALPQACRNLVGTAGITGADCGEVVAAVSAVEMRSGGAYPRNAELCPGGGTARDLFDDDLENPASGNWTLQTEAGVNAWYYPQPPEMTYATSGHTNLWGFDQMGIADYSIAMTRSIRVPEAEAVYLHFEHAYAFVHSGMRTFDGGVVEYSSDEGRTWRDAGDLLDANGYDGVISGLTSMGFDNPLEHRRAFVRESKGYGSSRANLGSLSGQDIRFRFRIGTSGWAYDDGWFIDDIRIYTCSIHPPTTSIAGPSKIVAGDRATWTLSATDAAPDDQAGVFRYTIDWNGDGRGDATASHGSSLRLGHAYERTGRYTITVTAADHHGSESRSVTWTIVVRAPVRIVSSSLVLGRRGYVAVRVMCRATRGCLTTVTIRIREPIVLLGSARRMLGAGRTTDIRVMLSPDRRALVQRLGVVGVTATVVSRGRVTKTLVLRAG